MTAAAHVVRIERTPAERELPEINGGTTYRWVCSCGHAGAAMCFTPEVAEADGQAHIAWAPRP